MFAQKIVYVELLPNFRKNIILKGIFVRVVVYFIYFCNRNTLEQV